MLLEVSRDAESRQSLRALCHRCTIETSSGIDWDQAKYGVYVVLRETKKVPEFFDLIEYQIHRDATLHKVVAVFPKNLIPLAIDGAEQVHCRPDGAWVCTYWDLRREDKDESLSHRR